MSSTLESLVGAIQTAIEGITPTTAPTRKLTGCPNIGTGPASDRNFDVQILDAVPISLPNGQVNVASGQYVTRMTIQIRVLYAEQHGVTAGSIRREEDGHSIRVALFTQNYTSLSYHGGIPIWVASRYDQVDQYWVGTHQFTINYQEA